MQKRRNSPPAPGSRQKWIRDGNGFTTTAIGLCIKRSTAIERDTAVRWSSTQDR